jgi:hypothetical protein
MVRSSRWLIRGLRSVAGSPLRFAQSTLSGTQSLKSSVGEHADNCFASAPARRDSEAFSTDIASSETLHRVLNSAIDEITEKFDQARLECDAFFWDSNDCHKWKGEMIAYANAVAVLERLKRLAAPPDGIETGRRLELE